MSAANGQDLSWADFDNLRHSVKSYTVDKLKQIIVGINEECGASLSKGGKKQDLIDRIMNELDKMRYMHQIDNWNRARQVLHQVRTSGHYTSSGPTGSFTANRNYPQANASGPVFSHKAGLNGHHSSGGASTSSIGRYDPYAPPRLAVPASSSSSPARTGVNVNIRFKSSPFFRTDQAVSTVIECPESGSSMDRRSQSFSFSLNQEQINKLTQANPKYQVRLYCTTNAFYNPSNGFRTNLQPCPIEFPATCEVRVNGQLLQANLKGIKKKPGTAPPADLTKVIRMSSGTQNRVEMVYVNSQANSVPKKFYLVVFLVEVSTVEQLVDRLRKGKYRTMEDIRAKMTANTTDDDDIVAGKQKMSLKCPLSYTRIKVPSRSEKCVHPQCFDAFSWYSVMEQTTTWLCPVCEKVLNPEELIVDGYFENILKQTPESIEEVEVEPNGEWHTADNKYGPPAWMDTYRSERSANGSDASSSKPNARRSPPDVPQPDSVSALGSRSTGEVFVLDSDSDNEDEYRVKKELSPTNSASVSKTSSRNGASGHQASISTASTPRPSAAVIYLTLDSDTEDAPPPPPPSLPLPSLKRKASDLPSDREDDTYKRQRAADLPKVPLPIVRRDSGGPYALNGASASAGSASGSSSPFSRTLPPPIPTALPGLHATTSSTSRTIPPSSVSPLTPYEPLPPYSTGQRPYGHSSYNAAYSQRPPPNGNAVPYNASSDPSRRLPPPQPSTLPTSYNPYLSRSNGSGGGSSWP